MSEQTPLTIEQCREYSAVEILGCAGRIHEASDVPYYTDGERGYGAVACWRPDKDRDQLYELLKSLGYEDEDAEDWFKGLFRVKYVGSGPSARMGTQYSFDTLCLQFPAEALQAICEAHRRHNG